MPEDRIVAVGLLTARDLAVLGTGFSRCFSLPDDDAFAALIRELEKIAPVEDGEGAA
jgi:hypothetical protein